MPEWKPYVRQHLATLAVPPALAEEIVEELALDLEQRYTEARASGASEEEALALAQAELKDSDKLAAEIRRAMHPVPARPPADHGLTPGKGGIGQMLADVAQDLRYGVRMLFKSPMFSAVAVLSLALGIGANTTIFTLVNALILQPLPVGEPSRLASVYTVDEKNTGRFLDFLPVSFQNYKDYREQNQVFSGLTAAMGAPFSLTTGGEPEQVFGEIVAGNYFDVLGVKASVGRTFSLSFEEDKQLGSHPLVFLSHDLWKRRFGADRNLVGQTILLNRRQFTVIGVGPENFRGTFGVAGPHLWVPFSMHNEVLNGFLKDNFEDRRAVLFNLHGRLKPGVTVEQANASLQIIGKRLAQAYPDDNAGRNVTVLPFTRSDIGPAQAKDFYLASAVGMGIVALVLLIACANVANLLLARASSRQREIAVRLSLGASRGRLVRQLMTESVVLALLAGVVGLAFAYWGRDVLWSMRPAFLKPDDLTLTLDGRVLGFTMLTSLLTGVLFGLVPALQASKPNLAVALKDSARQSRHASRWFGVRNILVMAQVALSLVALVGAGLFVRSLANAQKIEVGFETKRLMVLSFDAGAEGYTGARAQDFYRQVVDRVKTLPMVENAAMAFSGPFNAFQRTVFPEGLDPSDKRNGHLTPLNEVLPGYFETMGIPLLRGRGFTEADNEAAPMVAVINQTMAKKLWPNEDPIGKRFRCFGETWIIEIVGIARDTKVFTLGEEPQAFFYMPLLQHYEPFVTLHVRTAGDPSAVVGTVRNTVQAMERNMPLTFVNTVSQVIDQALWPARMGASLLGVFGGLALLLAALGIHGVISYSVAQRTPEIGIRMALGAQPGDVVRMVLGQALAIVTIGAVVGLAGAFAAVRGLGSLLFDVGPTDPVTFGGTAALLLVVALLASYIPALRAARIDPLEALRYE